MMRTHVFVPEPRPNSAEILLAVGPLGHGATFWRSVASHVPDQVELRAVRLPGRENRYTESPYVKVQDAAREIADDLLAELPDRPVSVAGLCSGAVIAFETARELERRGTSGLPSRLVLADRVHPTARPPFEPTYSLPSANLFERLVARDLLPPVVADDPSVFTIFESTWRGDLELIEQYTYADAPPLNCPIVAIVTTAQREGARRWAEETTACFRAIDVGSRGGPLSSAPAEELGGWLTEAMKAISHPDL
jgi:medium-chain acyl-[acyl-carrier-protein] hydrolase